MARPLAPSTGPPPSTRSLAEQNVTELTLLRYGFDAALFSFLFKRAQIICRNQEGVLELVKFSRELASFRRGGCFHPTRISRECRGWLLGEKLNTNLCNVLKFNNEMSPQ